MGQDKDETYGFQINEHMPDMRGIRSRARLMRKCRYCKSELPAKKDCATPYQRAGYCDDSHMAQHGIEKAKAARKRKQEREAKAKRAKHRADKERLKTKAQHMREAQQAFNAYIRERDRDLPCISCGNTNPGGDPRGGVWDCSHYRSVGASPELRFEPLNAHKGCKQCNRDKSGNIVEYRLRLIDKIGQRALDWLEGKHEPKRYTIEELKEIKAAYRAKVRELKRSVNNP